MLDCVLLFEVQVVKSANFRKHESGLGKMQKGLGPVVCAVISGDLAPKSWEFKFGNSFMEKCVVFWERNL